MSEPPAQIPPDSEILSPVEEEDPQVLQQTGEEAPIIPPQQPVRQSTQQRRMTARAMESIQQQDLDKAIIFSAEYYDQQLIAEEEIDRHMEDSIAFSASNNPDTLYYHQAMRQPDRDSFIQVIIKEVNRHIEGQHWEMVRKEEIPKGAKVLDAVWAFKKKQDIKTQQVYKHKERLDVHGGQQQYGINYFDTYATVVTWPLVWMALILSLLHGWYTRQIDFVMAYPHADIKHDLNMKLPTGIEANCGSDGEYILKLRKNIYGQKQARQVWYTHLKDGLLSSGFIMLEVDKCVFYRGRMMFLC
eukprot:15358370-Ditylum_brightwellii.AAC.1